MALAGLVLCGTLMSCSQNSGAQIPNPMVSVSGSSAFESMNVSLAAPEGATQISYYIISDEIAHIAFTYENREYVYRGSSTKSDIAGLYFEFDAAKSLTLDNGQVVTYQTIASGAEGFCAKWQIGAAHYTLYTGNKISAEEIVAIIKKVA